MPMKKYSLRVFFIFFYLLVSFVSYSYSQATNAYIWGISTSEQLLYKIDKESLDLKEKISIGENAFGIAVDDTYVWITCQAEGKLIRINKKDYSNG